MATGNVGANPKKSVLGHLMKDGMMKRTLLASVAAVIVSTLVVLPSAQADVLWNNGAAVGAAFYCNNSGTACGSSGWTIYDDFTLSSASNIQGLTYNTNLSGNTYVSTNYSIWASDPQTSFGSGPASSGTSIGTQTADAVGTVLITITGLNINLDAGKYWLGLQNNMSGGGLSTYDNSSGTGLDYASQSDNTGNFFNSTVPAAAFTVEGAVENVPEPANLALLGAGLFGLAQIRRRRA